MAEIVTAKSTDIVSYSILREKYGTIIEVAMVIDWVDEETLRVLTLPGKEFRKIKASSILQILTQDEIKQAIASAKNKK